MTDTLTEDTWTFAVDRIAVQIVVARFLHGKKVDEQIFNTPPFFHPFAIPAEVFAQAEAQAEAQWEQQNG